MNNELQKFLDQFDNLTTSSINLNKSSIFVAYPGEKNDGRDFIFQAAQNGAKAILYDPINYEWNEDCDLPHFAVDNLQNNLSYIADQFYKYPSKKIHITGVTGTNGKTSCVFWLTQCLSLLKSNAAFIGTIGYGKLRNFSKSLNTTPNALITQLILHEFYKAEIENVAMEVSSHGVAQGRVAAINFDVKLFTNLTRDHLDYHGSIESYAKVKTSFMLSSSKGRVVINIDDDLGRLIYKESKLALTRKISYAIDCDADIKAININYINQFSEFDLLFCNETYHIKAPVIGKFNIYNILGVIGCLISMGYKIPEIIKSIKNLSPVPGRVEFITNKSKNMPSVVIDYAHTPDALKNILLSLKILKPKRIILVFGCGGNRDRGKREDMARVVNNFADFVIVTSDNPRDEDPIQIMKDITKHLEVNYVNIEDRADAIDYAINKSGKNDLVLIAGKGHEEYQEIKGKRNSFSDKKIAKKCLSKKQGVKN